MSSPTWVCRLGNASPPCDRRREQETGDLGRQAGCVQELQMRTCAHEAGKADRRLAWTVDGAHTRTQRFTCSHGFMFTSSAWTGDGAGSGLDRRRSTLGQATSLGSRRSTRTQRFTCSHVFMFTSSAWTGDGAHSGQATLRDTHTHAHSHTLHKRGQARLRGRQPAGGQRARQATDRRRRQATKQIIGIIITKYK
jgi:hypothetical protein